MPYLIPIVAMAIPIVAIVGGITAGIVRTLGQQKIAEMAMRERIAAIEKGLDPARLPPLPALVSSGEIDVRGRTARERALRTAQGLWIAGIITFAAGVGLTVMFFAFPEAGGHGRLAIGVLPACVGAGLAAAGWVVRLSAPPERPAPAAPGETSAR